jgi:hypothetical protein
VEELHRIIHGEHSRASRNQEFINQIRTEIQAFKPANKKSRLN